jgi:hypothetical protein
VPFHEVTGHKFEQLGKNAKKNEKKKWNASYVCFELLCDDQNCIINFVTLVQ